MREPTEPDNYERDWESMSERTLGELLEMKLHPQSTDHQRTLAQMELDRRTYVLDRQFDRRVAFLALVISIIALIVTMCRAPSVEGTRAVPAPTATPLQKAQL